MTASPAKKTVIIKEKKSISRQKAVKSPTEKVSDKPSSKTKKNAVSGKKKNKIAASKIAASKKPVVKKMGKVKKSHEKTETSKNRLIDLRKFLLSKKESILKEAKDEIAKYISGENKQLIDTANDEGDWAQVDISEDLNLQRLSAHRKLMHNIDEALRKISEGTYGVCEDCGEEISAKRLMVLPAATLCVDCQENKEQMETFESSD